jgi:protein arginine N-methyltransferase 1
MKNWIIQEPLIEGIEQKTLNSDPSAIFELDLYKAQISDLDFSSSYRLMVHRNDYVHGLVAWFDVFFTE